MPSFGLSGVVRVTSKVRDMRGSVDLAARRHLQSRCNTVKKMNDSLLKEWQNTGQISHENLRINEGSELRGRLKHLKHLGSRHEFIYFT